MHLEEMTGISRSYTHVRFSHSDTVSGLRASRGGALPCSPLAGPLGDHLPGISERPPPRSSCSDTRVEEMPAWGQNPVQVDMSRDQFAASRSGCRQQSRARRSHPIVCCNQCAWRRFLLACGRWDEPALMAGPASRAWDPVAGGSTFHRPTKWRYDMCVACRLGC